MALKRHHPDVRFSGNKVTPDEIDRYEVVSVRPAINASWWSADVVGGTSAVVPLTIAQRFPDWPRNVRFALAGTHAAMVGTVTLSGRDQFGSEIQETIVTAQADNGGTAVGTKVFARLDSGTLSYGTAVGNGTVKLGFDATGTTLLLGLPFRLGSVSDVVSISFSAGASAAGVNGGTVSGFVNLAQSAIKAPDTVTGTSVISAWVRPTADYEDREAAALRAV